MRLFVWLLSLVAILVYAPVFAAHVGESPFEPSEVDEQHFVVDEGSGLDTGCSFRTEGPLIIKLKIDRYVGETNPDGTLKDPDGLITQGVIAPKARLRMPAFDVDSGATPQPPKEPEVDKVSFNGRELAKPLTGLNQTWIMNEFEIDTRHIKFPARGVAGSKPQPVENEIRIDIDTANEDIGEEVWCTSIDWVELEVKAMAPMLLVHGIASGPDTWVPAAVNLLQQHHIPFEHQIQLGPNATIDANAATLAQVIQQQAASFGVKSVHLVCHSKGGLDTRRYLTTLYNPDQVRILSMHTLSSPHHGSVLADISIANRTVNDPSSEDGDIDAYLDNDGWADFFNQGPQRPGLDNLQTGFMQTFNQGNAFPSDILLHTYGGDADLNNDGAITVAEATPLIPDIPPLVDAAEIGTLLYRLLRDVTSITVTRRTSLFGLNEWHEITPNPTAGAQDNDLSVTDTSSQLSVQAAHFGPLNRNHANIKDGATFESILNTIRTAFPLQ